MKSGRRLLWRLLNWQRKPLLGRLTLLCLLTVVAGCASASKAVIQKSSYQPQIPLLLVAPRTVDCDIIDTKTGKLDNDKCTLLLQSDFQAIIREMKAECLGLTGDNDVCQTIEPKENKKEGS